MPQLSTRLVALLATLPIAATAGAQQINTAVGASSYASTELGEEQLSSGAGSAQRGVHSMGQTFVAPTATPRLDEFTFQISAYDWWAGVTNPNRVTFRAFVMAFDEAANRPVGPVLWESPATPGTTDPTGLNALGQNAQQATGWVTRTFTTGGVVLTPGTSYVALLSQLLDPALLTDRWGLPYPGIAYNQVLLANGGGYTDGHVYRTIGYTYGSTSTAIFQDFLSNGPDGDGTATTSINWDDRNGGADAVFTASFGPAAVSAVPEPATVALVAAGLLALGTVAQRRRTR